MLVNFRVDTIPKLMEKIPTFEADLKNVNTFAEIYDFTFMWSRESPEKKTLGPSFLFFFCTPPLL
jgi:hypothetical protein